MARALVSVPMQTVLVATLFAGAATLQAQDWAHYEPTPQQTVERMLDIADVGADDFVIDLGSGDGRIVIAAAQRGARGLGVDVDPKLVRKAEANANAAGVSDRVRFREQDLFEVPLAEAKVITLYLLPEMNRKLRPSLLALRPGTRVVSHRWRIGDWQPDRSDGNGPPVHLWIVPANVTGPWRLHLADAQGSVEIEFQQTYQELSGEAQIDGRSLPVRDGRLRGNEIEFAVAFDGTPALFRGTVRGGRMEGTVDAAGGKWQAERTDGTP